MATATGLVDSLAVRLFFFPAEHCCFLVWNPEFLPGFDLCFFAWLESFHVANTPSKASTERRSFEPSGTVDASSCGHVARLPPSRIISPL